MWILSFLPDWIFHAITLAGIIGIVVSSFFAFLIPIHLRFIIRIAVLMLLVLGFFMEGASWNEQSWKIKISEMEKEIAELETKSGKVTLKVVTKYVETSNKTKEIGDDITSKTEEVISVTSNNNCVIPTGAVVLHNAAASKTALSDTTGTVNEAPSGVELSEYSKTVTNNYTKYHMLSDQLKSLQEWIIEQKNLNP